MNLSTEVRQELEKLIESGSTTAAQAYLLVKSGRTAREAGVDLGVTEGSVRVYYSSVLQVLGEKELSPGARAAGSIARNLVTRDPELPETVQWLEEVQRTTLGRVRPLVRVKQPKQEPSAPTEPAIKSDRWTGLQGVSAIYLAKELEPEFFHGVTFLRLGFTSDVARTARSLEKLTKEAQEVVRVFPTGDRKLEGHLHRLLFNQARARDRFRVDLEVADFLAASLGLENVLDQDTAQEQLVAGDAA